MWYFAYAGTTAMVLHQARRKHMPLNENHVHLFAHNLLHCIMKSATMRLLDPGTV